MAKLILEDQSYGKIQRETGASSGTISKIKIILNRDNGLKRVLKGNYESE
ncbi:hypothetical protein JTI58_17130 [Lysinibacillus fusiformis]|nr:hypothetical protein JTI58_17130 [Lysinibacillus fusiformis]